MAIHAVREAPPARMVGLRLSRGVCLPDDAAKRIMSFLPPVHVRHPHHTAPPNQLPVRVSNPSHRFPRILPLPARWPVDGVPSFRSVAPRRFRLRGGGG